MIALIRQEATGGYFRWHDSGDIQSIEHLGKINDIAWALPEIKFWLPTRELGIVSHFVRATRVAPNLIIRLSAAMVDARRGPQIEANGRLLPVSFVHTGAAARVKGTRVCPAPKQEGKCQQCRSCWDPSKNVSYHKH